MDFDDYGEKIFGYIVPKQSGKSTYLCLSYTENHLSLVSMVMGWLKKYVRAYVLRTVLTYVLECLLWFLEFTAVFPYTLI